MLSSAILGIATLVLWATGANSGELDARPLDLPSLVGESLAATRPHVTPGELRVEALKVQARLSTIVERMGEGPADYERAKRLHRLLHRNYLETYRRDADGLTELLETGEYNCLSATLAYGLLARELGYEVIVLERPGHLLLGLELEGERIAIETTSPKGYDRAPRHDSAWFERGSSLERGPSRPVSSSFEPGPAVTTREFPLEAMIGFAWLNAAWRELSAERPFNAAKRVDRARRFLPYLVGTEDAQQILSRAFFREYEVGRFESAYRIARIEFGLWPGMTTSRDRLLASAVKRIENAVDDGEPGLAAGIAREVARMASPGRDVARFERRVWPLIATAAVRLSDWALASSSADRYARVEPDSIEADRLSNWVDERIGAHAAQTPSPICERAPCVAATARFQP